MQSEKPTILSTFNSLKTMHGPVGKGSHLPQKSSFGLNKGGLGETPFQICLGSCVLRVKPNQCLENVIFLLWMNLQIYLNIFKYPNICYTLQKIKLRALI